MNIKFKILVIIGVVLIGGILFMSILGLKVFASYKEINQEEKFSLEEIDEIQVNMTKENIRIIQKDIDSKVEFHLYGKSKQDIKLISKINNKVIVIGANCEANPIPRNFDPTPEDLYLDIYIPEKYEKSILINVTSGMLVVENLKAKDATIHSSSGEVNIKKLNTERLKITGKSSAISINECLANEADMETSSGNIILNDINGNLKLKTSSGRAQVSYKEFGDQNINIGTSSGTITLQLPRSAEFILDATTSTGKIKSDFPVNMIDNKTMAGQVGAKNNEVLLKSSSGSISVLKIGKSN